VSEVFAGLAGVYDRLHGGFGRAPKFFCAPAVELLLAQAWSGNRSAGEMAWRTLEEISRGGVYDLIGGGFHRYSVDDHWHVPHFEKMAADNAAMLAVYANAFALAGREEFARVARETIAWIDAALRDPSGRGYGASQDADVGPDDDGDYFTWTAEEVRGAISEGADLVISYCGIDEAGDVPGRGGRSVLRATLNVAEEAERLGLPERVILHAISRAREQLRAARERRTAPKVDRTIFADVNGMMIDAYLTAWERLGLSKARQTALAAADALLADLRDGRGVFAHYRDEKGLHEVGLLADQAWMGRALLHAFAATAEPRYLQAAAGLADFLLEELRSENGGLLSSPRGAVPLPGAGVPAAGMEDAPSRSPASVAAQMLVDLGHLTGRREYAAAGVAALESLAGGVKREWGVFLAGFALAADHCLSGPRGVVIVGGTGDTLTAALATAARAAYVPGAMVLQIDPSRPEQAAILERLGYSLQGGPVAYVCRGRSCLAPARTVEDLRHRIRELARSS
jgi:uncharacterized protein YyaL (SSP411 family)